MFGVYKSIDWLRVIVKPVMSIPDVCRILKIPPHEAESVIEASGMFGYTTVVQTASGVRIGRNMNRPDMGVIVDMSGGVIDRLMDMGFNPMLAIQEASKRGWNISRVDVAIDLCNIGADMAQFVKMATGGEHEGVAATIYHDVKSGGSSVYHKGNGYTLVIYDKKRERGREDIQDWVRFEIRLNGNYSSEFAKGASAESIVKRHIVYNHIMYYIAIAGEGALRLEASDRGQDKTEQWLMTSVISAMKKVIRRDKTFLIKWLATLNEEMEYERHILSDAIIKSQSFDKDDK